MPSQTIILLAALGPLREALFRASQGLESGHAVQIVCFRKDLFELLSPLVESGVKLELWPEGLYTFLGRPFRMAAELSHFQRSLETAWSKSRGADVFAYGTSISLPAILATTYLARRNAVYYNGLYEGRGASDGIFYERTESTFRRWKARFISMLVGAPLEYCRDWGPVLVLSEAFVRDHFLCLPSWNADAISNLEEKLICPCEADIVVLFTNHADYYQTSEKDAASTRVLWDSIEDMLRNLPDSLRVAVKPHPSYSRVPDSWSWMEILPPGFPAELIQFIGTRVLLGDASSAMIDLGNRMGIPVISYAHLYTAAWAPEITKNLDVRVDPGKTVLRGRSLAEVENQIQQILKNKQES